MQERLLHNQSIQDFALNHCGTVESAIMICRANNLSPTEVLSAGLQIEIPKDSKVSDSLVNFFKVKKIVPAFGYKITEVSESQINENNQLNNIQLLSIDANTVLHNQSLIDFSIQRCGRLDDFLKIAMENGISPTDKIIPGAILKLPQNLSVDIDIVNHFTYKKIIPAFGDKMIFTQSYLDFLLPNTFPIL